jgi:hypothetical protein
VSDDVLDDGWHERGDHDQNQDDNGADDEAALSDAFLIFVPNDQANITHSVLMSCSTCANCYGTLLLWCAYGLL